ncbi:MAG: ATP-dependent RNA helicase [Opitutaceae bacterium]
MVAHVPVRATPYPENEYNRINLASDPADLPVHEIKSRLLEALREHRRAIVQAPTGSGKSTQIPQMLLRSGAAENGEIVVLQPRRIAARMLARRVAQEMGVTLGGEVGYQVRLESRVSPATRIRFVTEGILLRQMVSDPRLRGVSTILFDEFHERHLYGDITLGRALQLQERERPDLRLVVMSATLQMGQLAEYLAPCPTVISEGRTFPVTVRYLPKPMDFEKTPVWDAAADATAGVLSSGIEGDALIFMPGAFEIARTCDALRHRLGARDFEILPLHGELPPAEQDRAVDDSARRKIIVATNVAETSLTIPGVRLVVDAGMARVARFDPHRGIDTLLVEKVSQASAEQRAGRAGRTAPGVCLRLWTEREHEHRAVAELPEVKRRDLAEVVLTLKAAGIDDVAAFPWLESPEPKALARAETLLRDLGALRFDDGAITPLGRRMLGFPAHPRYARMLVEAGERGCVREVATIAALTQGRPILIRNPGKEVERAREEVFGDERKSDFLQLLAALEFAERARFSVEECRRVGVHAQAARLVRPLAEQFLALAEKASSDSWPAAACPEPSRRGAAGSPASRPGPQRDAIRRCVLAGFADQVARRLDRGTLRCELVHGRRGMLARESVVQDAALLVVAEINEIGGRGGEVTTLLGACTAIDERMLAEIFPGELRTEETAELDTTTKRVSMRRRVLFRDLVLEDRETGEATADAAVKILTREVREGRVAIGEWDESVEHWIMRVNTMAALFPEFEVATITTADRDVILEQIVLGARTLREVRERPVWPTLKSWLSPEQLAALDKLFPERLEMPNGRRARITYKPDGSATLSARIQELFGVEKNIVIAQGRLPLRLEILAPNQRPREGV